ncbi:MAG: 3-phosphoshikimate 1-carboxyvinyltransferase [Dysgonamonadaceae bacterium]|jgi:3-phosphoshikimate 1-carboxyvinyltransferase|nr:3-phosphoshikimate 1-carboxyvinyltransferase [Dysgonamonadaceae bacterium]
MNNTNYNTIYNITPPDRIDVSLKPPSSKSISNRVLVINALSGNVFPIQNLSDSDDTRVMIDAFNTDNTTVDIGAAGTAMRFLTAYFAQTDGVRILTGSERMKNRPVKILADSLRSIGGEIEYLEKEGFPPLKITGHRLQGGNISLDGSVSSQYISALMMIAPMMNNGLTIDLEGQVVSFPYIIMTARLMELFGVKPKIYDNSIQISQQQYVPRAFSVESDWTGASYWYEIASLAKCEVNITISDLRKNSLQGDSKVAELFYPLGVITTFTDSGVKLQNIRDRTLPVFLEYDFTDEPDLVQTMAVTACMLGIPFRFSGLQSLRIKETDRIFALQTELKKLGYILSTERDNLLEWKGERCEPEHLPVIATYDDHRMALAFAPACLYIDKIHIAEPQVVSKSYPSFWNDLKKAGFKISLRKHQ